MMCASIALESSLCSTLSTLFPLVSVAFCRELLRLQITESATCETYAALCFVSIFCNEINVAFDERGLPTFFESFLFDVLEMPLKMFKLN